MMKVSVDLENKKKKINFKDVEILIYQKEIL
jgi:hypothetical protein